MNYFRGRGLKPEHFNKEVRYIIENFLVEEAITIFYAPPKNGKSRLALGLTKYLCSTTSKIVEYFDFDNSLASLNERGAALVIGELSDCLDYVHPEISPMTSKEVLTKLTEGAEPGAYEDYVFLFDSVTDFVPDVQNENMAKAFMNDMKKLRNAGATLILLHHTNKNEKNYQGSPVFKSAVDNMYYMHQGNGTEKNDLFLLDVDAGRFHVENTAFYLNKSTYALSIAPYADAIIKPDEQVFIDSVKEVLKKYPDGIGQSELLKELGKAKADKQARASLSQYIGRFWKMDEGKNNSKIYHIL